jgi:GT2 family glycosyltransferase
VEVVIVDSGVDRRQRRGRARRRRTRARDRAAAFNHGATRNLAVSLARGDLLVFTSQDAHAEGAAWLEHLTAPLRADQRVAGVYGRQIANEDAKPPERFFLDFLYGPAPRVQRAARREELSMDTTLFSNANSAIRRSVFEELPFVDDIIMSEDQEWSQRALLAGYTLVYEPRAAVRHSHPYTVPQAFRRFFDSGVSAERAYLAGAEPSQAVLRRRAVDYARREVGWLLRNGHARLAAVRRRLRAGEVRRPAAGHPPPVAAPPAQAAPERRPLVLDDARMSSVCAFVLTRNRKVLLAECLRGLLAQTHPVDEIVVLDNASDDGTEEHLRAEGLLDRVTYHRASQNTGGAGRVPRGRAAGDRGRPRLDLAHGRRRRAARRRPGAAAGLRRRGARRRRGGVLGGRAPRRRDRPAAPLPDGPVHRPLAPSAYEPAGASPWSARRSSVCSCAPRPRARPGCRSRSSSSATTTRSTRCACAGRARSSSSPRPSCCTRSRSAAAARRPGAARGSTGASA